MARDYAAMIRGLIAQADHPNTSDIEAAAFRAKAEELMKAYRVAEEDALAVDPALVVPTHLDVVLTVRNGELSHHYPSMVRTIAQHTQVRVRAMWGWNENTQVLNVTAVGYEGDLRFFELLWTNAQLMFSTKIDVTWDDNLSEAENVYRMRQAGIKRREIADRAWKNGDQAAARSKVQRIYVRESAARGEDPLASGLSFSSANYRQAYAQSFVDTLRTRLRIARDAAESRGGLPEHKGRRDRVDEAFYAKFPAARPWDVQVSYTDPTKECVRCQRAKTTCNDHRAWRETSWTKRDELAAQRRENGSAVAGRRAGRSAAEGVVVTRGHTTERRITPDRKSLES